MLVNPPTKPRWLPKYVRRGWINHNRHRLARKHGSRRWTYKGCLTRIFGQGIQGVFKKLPCSRRAAITGSMGVAVYDMIRNKRDLNWIPNDVDVFVAISPRHRQEPLGKLYPIMTQWLRSVQDQGFMYKQTKSCYSRAMCVFDFECTNAQDFPNLRIPKISFVARPAMTVRDICEEFDLPICGPILCRRTRNSPIGTWVTEEIRHLFTHRVFYSRVYPASTTREGRSTFQRIKKYIRREFEYMETDDRDPMVITGAQFPRFPNRIYNTRRPVCKRFIIRTLGREPTEQECLDFNITP